MASSSRSLLALTLTILALVLAIATAPAAAKPVPIFGAAAFDMPLPKATANVSNAPPYFRVYSQNGFKGKSATVNKYGCVNHGLTAIAGVKKLKTPTVALQFYSGKNCTGKVTHSMPDDSFSSMGGPYPSQSVKVTKIK